MPYKQKIDEVSLIRPVLICLLVLYHSFAPYCEAWEPFEGYIPSLSYWWIGKAAYSFMLPMFVFISGYIWSYQREICKKKEFLADLIKKNLKG